ncbi:hypothetical protein Slin15195_G099760 [Septoria linicola]|uniref:Uncharacterized protein n=1 Tax=Septoria linicola TaxID=215465 RepID=A0A9Q9ENI6_9PEZI|nr:hypothetical protein Slin15195_G099760 [Septoria linicola]
MSQATIHVERALSSTKFAPGNDCSISLTATLDYPTPITIFTWPTIFNLKLSQKRWHFYCIDVCDNDKPIQLNVENPGKRGGGISRQRNGPHDRYFVTFRPSEPVTITEAFELAIRQHSEQLKPGHRYRFGINRSKLSLPWVWTHGTREEILTAEQELLRDHEQSQIVIHANDVDFEVTQ